MTGKLAAPMIQSSFLLSDVHVFRYLVHHLASDFFLTTYFFLRLNRKKVPAVPESLLKRRKAYAAMKAMRVKKLLAEKKVK